MSSMGKEFDEVKNIAADAQEHLSQLKDDAARIVHQAANVGRAGVNAVRDQAGASTQAVRDVADQAYNRGNDLIATLQKRIEENPAQAIAVAAGVGVVLGLLLRRRH